MRACSGRLSIKCQEVFISREDAVYIFLPINPCNLSVIFFIVTLVDASLDKHVSQKVIDTVAGYYKLNKGGTVCCENNTYLLVPTSSKFEIKFQELIY